jgi:hypothetical protein
LKSFYLKPHNSENGWLVGGFLHKMEIEVLEQRENHLRFIIRGVTPAAAALIL